MKKKPLISCRNLTFSYQKKRILKNITLDFYPGEVVGLLGRNGAGKSTLLSCLCGLLSSEFQHLSIKNLDMAKAGRKDIARVLSFVPQEHADMFPFSVLDVVVMGRAAYLSNFGAPGKGDIQLAEQVLFELQIKHLTHRVYTTLSGGEKQLVLLARALVQTREIVFLDEPTNHLDYKNRYHMLAQLKRLSKDHDSCVVACLHDPNHALLFADRVILLHEGKILDHGDARTVLTCDAVSRLYGIAAWKGKDESVESILPAFVHPAFRGRVLLLTGKSGEGKTTLLQQVIETNKTISFHGIVCPGTLKKGRRFSSTVLSIETGESTLFAQRADDATNSPFEFFNEGAVLAQKALASDGISNSDCVVIDEVGPLELEGKGHATLIPPILGLEKTVHIWAVRPHIVEEVCRRWMLVDPVIVNVSEPDAQARIENFLYQKKDSHA